MLHTFVSLTFPIVFRNEQEEAFFRKDIKKQRKFVTQVPEYANTLVQGFLPFSKE